MLCTTQLSSVLLERAHASVWGALGDPTQRGLVVHPCAAADEGEKSIQDRCRLYSVQLELLSFLPLSNELIPLYTVTQQGLQNVTVTIRCVQYIMYKSLLCICRYIYNNIITYIAFTLILTLLFCCRLYHSEALKRSKSTEETIFACCQLWQVTVRICAVLLLPIPTSTTTSFKQALGAVTERKEQFMDFLAPKAGVGEKISTFFTLCTLYNMYNRCYNIPSVYIGVLAVPLQLILKRSRWHAALCYHSLAQSLTTTGNQVCDTY